MSGVSRFFFIIDWGEENKKTNRGGKDKWEDWLRGVKRVGGKWRAS